MNELKFTFKKKLSEIPRGKYNDFLNKIFANGITRPTFYKIINIKKNSKQTTSADNIRILANVFNISMERCFTE